MPDNLLEQLLERCQTVAVGSLREGAKLVQAVEALFPSQNQLLNNIAGYVMVAPVRSKAAKLQDLATEIGEELPATFDSAIETQQIALSLLAARQILEALTLHISPGQSIVERRWDTRIGTLLLKAGYKDNQLLIRAMLPCGGGMSLRTESENNIVDRSDAGVVQLNLSNPCLDRSYSIRIQLDAPNSSDITFTLQLQA
ncbi:hypothetical protein ACQ4M3_40590 [Leptolyngbya sp. AN03gr2]|uniref:hypothetical protein n=1 Tax=unclassified Leptolyngbya TaxID=2650499 RepID=UPI003D31CCF0